MNSKLQQLSCYDTCGAPLCPYVDCTNMVWYPDEDVCHKEDRQFIRTQKKIKKRAINRDTMFTYEMLNINTQIYKSAKGINPENENYLNLAKTWLKNRGIKTPRKTSHMKKYRYACRTPKP